MAADAANSVLIGLLRDVSSPPQNTRASAVTSKQAPTNTAKTTTTINNTSGNGDEETAATRVAVDKAKEADVDTGGPTIDDEETSE